MKDLIKYQDKVLPELAKSTQDTGGSMLRVHFGLRWDITLVSQVKAEAVEDWIRNLEGVDNKPLSSASKGRVLGA